MDREDDKKQDLFIEGDVRYIAISFANFCEKMSIILKQFLFVIECAHQKFSFSQSDQVIVMMLEKGVSVIQSLGVKWSMSGSEIRVTLTRTENPGINLTRQMFRKTVPPTYKYH